MFSLPDTYELISEQRIEELKTDAYILRHKKSGARVAVMQNDDENKVFSIGFRTPPSDSTGVPHILEHSVLCGSKKYPAKDPFIELAKGSLNTFLNAMTYPDKTIYPVASCNDADFKNLMDVYMDAVLNPNIYTRPQIFMQEGWHYELESPQDELKYNGVVYNEMKGAFSSPDEVLFRYCLNSVFPDNSYSVESGGDPECIPNLSYEAFLGFHSKLYHPSNSYIYIYGNCDMEERLRYIDSEYLSHYDEITVDSEIELQKPFDAMQEKTYEYSVTEQEGTDHKTYLAYNVVIGDSLDTKLNIAMNVLCQALFSMPGAPIKQALIDAGIGDDISGSFENEIRQSMLSIVAKNTDSDRKEEFLKTVRDGLLKACREGIDRNSLLAGINSAEFQYRESDYGRFPKGLMYGIIAVGSWIYDDEKPFVHLALNDIYAELREAVDTGYFERLIEEKILNNTHASLVELKPVVGLTAINDQKTAKKLSDYKATLSDEEIASIVENTKALKQYQSEPSTEEELRKIPLLRREDISKDIVPYMHDEGTIGGVFVDHHNIYTNGIAYLTLSFDLSKVSDDELSYVGLLNKVFAYVDTDRHSFFELSNEIDINTGGIDSAVEGYTHVDSGENVTRFNVRCKSLSDRFSVACDLLKEIISGSDYSNTKRLKEILLEAKSRMQARFVSAGHSTAVGAAMAQMSVGGKISSLVNGIDFYNFVCGILDDFDAVKDSVVAGLKAVADKVYDREGLMISLTGDDELYKSVNPALTALVAEFPVKNNPVCPRNIELEKTKIGYKTASMVNYVARCGNFKKAGLEYDASLKVLDTILSYDYLWTEIRVKGGAYGCMDGFAITGPSYFCSYRDPNLSATNKVYEGIVDFIENFDADEREMTKYIIGTFSTIDIPLTPAQRGRTSFESLFTGMTNEKLLEQRLKALNTDVEDIRGLTDIVKAVLSDDYLCVVGNEEKLCEAKDMFDKVVTLFS